MRRTPGSGLHTASEVPSATPGGERVLLRPLLSDSFSVSPLGSVLRCTLRTRIPVMIHTALVGRCLSSPTRAAYMIHRRRTRIQLNHMHLRIRRTRSQIITLLHDSATFGIISCLPSETSCPVPDMCLDIPSCSTCFVRASARFWVPSTFRSSISPLPTFC